MTLVGIITDSETKLPIKGVVVSDGYSVTETDECGIYQLEGHKDARHVYYSVPPDYEIILNDGLPDFYREINKFYDVYRIDFELKKLKDGIENKFTLFCVADPQVIDENSIKRFKAETIKDLKNESINYDISYGIALGDMTHSKLEFMSEMKSIITSTGIKFFYTIGNHDLVNEASNTLNAIKKYEECFGPVNYSFNRGNAHIIVMNNMDYLGDQNFSNGFTKDQIYWLKDDLKYVNEDKLIVVCVHVPIKSEERGSWYKHFFEELIPYKEVHIMSAHSHMNQNVFISDYDIYEHVHGASCGAWWRGTINIDGTPNGYGVYNIENNIIKNWYYKSTNFDKNYQIRMYPPYSFDDDSGNIIANVWNADEKWTVELFEDGIRTGIMERYMDYDKLAYKYFISLGLQPPEVKGTTTWFRITDHLFKILPYSLNSVKMIKATDRFGNVYFQENFTTNLNEIKYFMP